MAHPPNKGTIAPIHLPTIGYWIGFWLVGLYWLPLLLSIFGASFEDTSLQRIFSSLPETIFLAALGGVVLQVMEGLYEQKTPSQAVSLVTKSLFWAALWTVIFFASRVGTACGGGIDSTACAQLHLIGLIIGGPIIFLYNALLGLGGSLLLKSVSRR